jgi:hypothetical protein
MANALLAVFYMSVIFGMFGELCCSMPVAHCRLAIIGFVLACFDKRPGITKVSPRYPITKATSSRYAAFQHPLDVELENVYSEPSSRNAKHAKVFNQERWTEIPL